MCDIAPIIHLILIIIESFALSMNGVLILNLLSSFFHRVLFLVHTLIWILIMTIFTIVYSMWSWRARLANLMNLRGFCTLCRFFVVLNHNLVTTCIVLVT